MKAILGKKIGMTQVYRQDGTSVPVTLLLAEGVKVSKHIKDDQNRDLIEIGIGVRKNPSRADVNNYKQLGSVPRFKFSYHVNSADLENLSVGTDILPTQFEEGEKVDVIGVTKGKGFQGVVKRHGFKGGPKTHGGKTGKYRSPGSIGSGTTPGNVSKGKKMPGRMGAKQQTMQNLKVVFVDETDNVIGLAGAIPGHKGSYVVIKTPTKQAK